MILYMENPKDSTPNLLELLQEFSEVSGYKISAQKSVALLYTRRKIEERNGIPIGKDKVKLLLFTDDVILYVENPKDSTLKFLELM